MSANVKYNAVKNVIEVEKDGVKIEITLDEVREMESLANTNVYYREDVTQYINDLYNDGEISKEIRDNEDFANDLLDEYARLREKYDGDAEGLDWQECLDEAMESLDLDDYEEVER